jgi:hypothetical protein
MEPIKPTEPTSAITVYVRSILGNMILMIKQQGIDDDREEM